jgi:hypothetical protein
MVTNLNILCRPLLHQRIFYSINWNSLVKKIKPEWQALFISLFTYCIKKTL